MAMLYFERIMERNQISRTNHKYGFLKNEKQTECLIRLLKHQIERNDEKIVMSEEDCKENDEPIYAYMCQLFAHFCDSTRYINPDLTSVKQEIQNMHINLQKILFSRLDIENNVYEINQCVFPRVKDRVHKDPDNDTVAYI